MITLPSPDPYSVEKSVKSSCASNVAVTCWLDDMVTVQLPVPLQPAPDQPAKKEPAWGRAVSVTTVPLSYWTWQALGPVEHPPSDPSGERVMVPRPLPRDWMERDSAFSNLSNLAKTCMSVDMVTVQVFVSLQTGPSSVSSPLKIYCVQPANTEPAAGSAVSVTIVPYPKRVSQILLSSHVLLAPAGDMTTLPSPDPYAPEKSLKGFLASNVAVTC